MAIMNIRTNNIPRDVIYDHELTRDERRDFDYLDWTAMDNGQDSASFFRFRGELYDLSTFTRVEPGGELDALGWQGVSADSMSSGTLVKFVEDGERVVVGTATF